MPKDMDGNEIAKGDTVTWESQSNGGWTTKTGKVVYAGEPCWASRLPPEVREELNGGRQLFDTCGSGLVVKVIVGGPRAKPAFYAPRLHRLKKVNAEEGEK